MACGHSTEVADGGGLRRVPRHAIQGEVVRCVRGHAQPAHDTILQHRQRAHLWRGTQRAHGTQHFHCHPQVPRTQWLVEYENVLFVNCT